MSRTTTRFPTTPFKKSVGEPTGGAGVSGAGPEGSTGGEGASDMVVVGRVVIWVKSIARDESFEKRKIIYIFCAFFRRCFLRSSRRDPMSSRLLASFIRQGPVCSRCMLQSISGFHASATTSVSAQKTKRSSGSRGSSKTNAQLSAFHDRF